MAGSSRIDDLSRALGRIEEGIAAAARDRGEFKQLLSGLDTRVHSLALDVKEDRAISTQIRVNAETSRLAQEKRIDGIENEVEELKEFRNWLLLKLAVVSAIVGGAFWIIWQAVWLFSAQIKAWAGKVFG